MALKDDYLKELKKRGNESKVYKSFQLDGLEIAQILGDEKHKALYIKLAKRYDVSVLRSLARQVSEQKGVRNKGAYFMTVLSQHDRT